MQYHSTSTISHQTFTRAVRPVTYNRTHDLPRLLPLWPHETAIASAGDHLSLIARLRRALRAERRRGIAGHWTYNLARHADLLRAYRAELEFAREHPRRRPQQQARRQSSVTCNVTPQPYSL